MTLHIVLSISNHTIIIPLITTLVNHVVWAMTLERRSLAPDQIKPILLLLLLLLYCNETHYFKQRYTFYPYPQNIEGGDHKIQEK